MALSEQQRQFGADATLVGIADWLNQHAALFDEIFESYGLDAIRLIDEFVKTDHEVVHDTDNWTLQILGVSSGGDVFGARVDDMETRARFLKDFKSHGQALLDAVGPRGSFVKACCVLDGRAHHAETYALELWRGGCVLGTLRYFDMVQFHRLDREDASEQFFVWMRREGRYIGERIELRLWNPFVHELFVAPETEKAALRQDPAKLREHPDVQPFAKGTYRSFFQMQRQPAALEITKHYYAAHYYGENPAVRGKATS
jgi:hypothetical protein